MTAKKAQPQKRGAKNYFKGSRLAFLEGYCNEYNSLRGKNHHQFWHTLFEEWWRRYPWRLPDHEEPPTEDVERMKELAAPGVNEEEQHAKSKVEGKLRQRITGWFSYRATVARNIRNEGGAWAPILKRIHKQSNPKPRCRSIVQQFMLEKPEAVDEAFTAQYGDGAGMNRLQRLNKRNEVAKELVTTTFKKMETELKQRALDTHERELKEWGLEMEGIEEAEDIEVARDSLFAAVHPLLKLIGEYSGCYVTLLTAAVDGTNDKPYFSAVHHFRQDAAKRVNWTEFNEEGFKDGVAGLFMKYIRWMEGTEGEQTGAVGPSTSTITTPTPPIAAPMTIHISQRPAKYKKRPLVPTEDSSGDEDDVDMNMEDNDSSGSSMEEGHVPAKRLRTATIVTRRSRATPASDGPAVESDVHLHPPSSTRDGSASLSNPNTATNTETETEPEIAGGSTNHSPASIMDVDKLDANSGAGNTVRAGVRHVRKLVNTPVTPPQPSSPSPESDPEEIPDFLTSKNNVYEYLSSVEESGFRKLLKAYISFELTVQAADPSHLRGMLTTARRPAAVGWWSSRARPSKIPPYDSLNSFAKSIVEWWIFIQPPWRKIQSNEIARDGGDWERLYQPGVNGLLNVIVLAHWWARILEERGSTANETYCWFISDVTWVLSQLTGVAREGGV